VRQIPQLAVCQEILKDKRLGDKVEILGFQCPFSTFHLVFTFNVLLHNMSNVSKGMPFEFANSDLLSEILA
jgi:hypothetical protein